MAIKLSATYTQSPVNVAAHCTDVIQVWADATMSQ